MGWFFGCFGSSSRKKKARNSNNRSSSHGFPSTPPPVLHKKSSPFPIPSSSIPISRLSTKDHVRSRQETQVPHSAPVARADLENALLHRVEKVERIVGKKDPLKDPWTQIDELEEELDDLRKKLEQENFEPKKVKEEATHLISCKSSWQTQSELGCKRKQSDGYVPVNGTQQLRIPPCTISPSAPSLLRQEEWSLKAADDQRFDSDSPPTVPLKEKRSGSHVHCGDPNGLATVLENLRASRCNRTVVTAEIAEGSFVDVTTVKCTSSRISADGHGDPDAKGATSSSPFPKHRYEMDDTTCSSAVYSLCLSDADDRNCEEDSGTFNSSYKYDERGAAKDDGTTRNVKHIQSEERRHIRDDDGNRGPISAREKLRTGRYAEALNEDDVEEDPFEDAMGCDGGGGSEAGNVENGGGRKGGRHIEMDEAVAVATERAYTRARRKPASPVLTPVENVFQWKDLKEKERRKAGKMGVEGAEGLRGRRGREEDENVKEEVMVSDSSRRRKSNRVDASLSDWGGAMAVDASLSGWLPKSKVELPAAIDDDTSSVGTWAAAAEANEALPSRADASFSHWAMKKSAGGIAAGTGIWTVASSSSSAKYRFAAGLDT